MIRVAALLFLNAMLEYDASLLYRPDDPALRFLPEGPYPCGRDGFSWVAIQHTADATTGSLNIFDLVTRSNSRYQLPGRPGFAYLTTDGQSFVVGLERHVGLYRPATGQWTELCGPVDTDVQGTIINDATCFDGGLIFGCKDLKFAEKKAGLYLWRTGDRKLIRLRNDQICSNGKKVITRDGQSLLLDIDSPTKTVVGYAFDLAAGTLGPPRVVLDLTQGDSFPDGMVVTPDGQSVIIAFYDPRDVPFGEARQYRIADGELEAIWRTAGSPRVTCPQLITYQNRVRLILTTAVEHMTSDQQALHANAGGLFMADTPFESVADALRFPV